MESLEPTGQKLSMHALMGHHVPQTLKIQGIIGKSKLSILVDSGNTHNFIQGRVACFLGPILTNYKTLTIKFVKDKGKSTMDLEVAISQQEKRMMSTKVIASLFQLQLFLPSSSPTKVQRIPKAIEVNCHLQESLIIVSHWLKVSTLSMFDHIDILIFISVK
ncbi:hypothetical protein CR513_52688, partial [Mucuna pruriens]